VLTSYEAEDNAPNYLYQVFVTEPLTIDMRFDKVFFTPESNSICESLRINDFHFKFNDRNTDERPSFFARKNDTISEVVTINAADAGTYTITCTQSTVLPNLVHVLNWVDKIITLVITYDQCHLTVIEDQVFDLNFLYEISPETQGIPILFELPYFTDTVTTNISGWDCTPMVY
jgi:hypothetical protein